MKTKRPATAAARRLFKALSALAEWGVNGERDNAREKLARLLERYDFTAPAVDLKDMFSGMFYKAPYSVPVVELPELDIASAVKWAIEGRTGISCRFAGAMLLAEATPDTAKTLQGIAETAAGAFLALWRTYEDAGAPPGDRGCFVRGLFDGMMQDERKPGEPLPQRTVVPKRRLRSEAKPPGPAFAVHPYSLALGYGRDIRFSVPLDKVENKLRDSLQKQIESKA